MLLGTWPKRWEHPLPRAKTKLAALVMSLLRAAKIKRRALLRQVMGLLRAAKIKRRALLRQVMGLLRAPTLLRHLI
jgi:hypothetical protein